MAVRTKEGLSDQNRTARVSRRLIIFLEALMGMETPNDAKHDPVFEQSLGYADSPTPLDTKTHRKIAK